MNNILANEAISELYTVQDLLRWSVSCFNDANLSYGHGYDNPWDEAIALILPTLNLPLDLPRNLLQSRLTTSEKKQVVTQVIKRITLAIPSAYLTNKAWFCQLEFYVDNRVLVPRSPIGELIVSQFKPWLTIEPSKILDLCTGSGCIAIACAHVFVNAEVDAVDISPDALAVAEINIHNHNMEQQVFPVRSDLFNELKNVKYDLIVSNPPYVDQEDMHNLPKEFAHEPEIGLAAGFDGLDLVKRILADATNHLTINGILICEVGNSMVHLMEKYPQVPFTWIDFEHGGHGVFMLNYQDLVDHKHLFITS